MTSLSTLAAIVLSTIPAAISPAPEIRGEEEKSSMILQIRTYATAPEKLDVLLERFARVNLPLFEKHGITLIGAWTPHESDESGDRLVYLVSFPSHDDAEAAWKSFIDDPGWRMAFKAEQDAHGQVVTEVKTAYLTPTDYSPELPSAEPDPASDDQKDERGIEGGGPRLFELRRYVASPGKLDALNSRFRDHTMDLFAKHDMTNILYTTPTGPDEGADEVLLYFLAHESYPKALNSWEGFRSDPEWTTVREASQPDGVPLAAEVESWMLEPTEFSPLK